ncbi:MAG: hypothetical protein Q4E24_15745 [bacterium]|nr:hypothetical protein [bacterium]
MRKNIFPGLTETEEKILRTIAEALPQMNDFQKGYFLGSAEEMLNKRNDNRQSSTA